MRIGLDLDGVLGDLVASWTRQYREAFGDPDYTHDGGWDLHRDTVFTDTESVFKYLELVPGFYEKMLLVPGAAGGCWQLVEDGHLVQIITNRPSTQVRATTEWLRSWWPSQKLLPEVQHVPGDKGVIDVQMYVEDNPDRLRQLVEAKKACVVVFDQPWNRDLEFESAPNLFRVAGWPQLSEFIRKTKRYGLEEAAAELNLSPGQLRKRLYRAGTSYKQIVLDIRMALAQHYLQDTALPVQEIAYLLDYSQPAPFSRAFKAYFGLSPEQSRNTP